jgi:oligopeptide/dipeptide ABC transporter, ATP-binding protein, C-terminal domain
MSTQTTSQPTVPGAATEPLIEIKNLHTYFYAEKAVVPAVNDVTLTIPKGKTLGLVGESGCGKSVTALSIIGLISRPGRIVEGTITLHEDGQPPVVLNHLPEPEMCKLRGSKVAMIFQEPMTSLNPVFTVGKQIMEAILLHQNCSKEEARKRALDALRKVRIPDPERRIDEYPHQFSGGMRQRVMIAMALACHPRLLIADEPTTALDVTIQAQVLDLLRDLQKQTGMSILFITHDLGVIAEMADYVAVMYASKVVEYASVVELFKHPLHPYTKGLFASRPDGRSAKTDRLQTIPGMVPRPDQFPPGCKFHPRCPFAKDRCRVEEPKLRELRPGHLVHCHFAEELSNV